MIRFGLMGCLATAQIQALAAPTGLNLIPSAEVRAHREFLVAYDLALDQETNYRRVDHSIAMEVGLWGRVEFGGDIDLDNDAVNLWNIKALVHQDKRSALAVGLLNGNEKTADPYAVGLYDFKWARLHLGIAHDSCTRLMAGIDAPLKYGVWLFLDGISGPEGQWWFGGSYSFPKHPEFVFTTGVVVPTQKHEVNQAYFEVAYVRKF